MSALAHGWEPMPSSVWLSVVDHLPRPLTTEQAAHDLRVYASQVRLGRRRKMPGRPALRKRWGWTDWGVRSLLADEAAWADPRTAPPADRQPTASAPPETAAIVEVEPTRPAIAPPAHRQPTSTRAELHRTQNTEHRLSTTPASSSRARSADAAGPKNLIPKEVEKHLVEQVGLLTLEQIASLTRSQIAQLLPVKLRNRGNLDLVERTLTLNGLSWASRDKPTRGEDRTAEIREANRTLHRRAFAHIYEAGEAK